MSDTEHRKRTVSKEWIRDPNGAAFQLDQCPKGKRPGNGLIWGHNIDDFFWIRRVPDLNALTIWSRSMIKEIGDYKSSHDGKDDVDIEPRRQRTWPVLKLPKNIKSDPPLSVIDEGSDHEECGSYEALQDEWDSEDERGPRSLDDLCTPSTLHNGIGDDTGVSEPTPSDATPPVTDPLTALFGIPKLEEFIPVEYFPDFLMVHDPDNLCAGDGPEPRAKGSTPTPKKYKRVYPAPSTSSSGDVKADSTSRVANVYVAAGSMLGVGNHSYVYQASMRLPYPLSARSPNKHVKVAFKTANRREEPRELLENEAKMYNAFPRHLMEDWCGYNLVTPINYPVPAHAVVPKFYGYYVPDYKGESSRAWKWDSPILLLEDCGEPIEPFNYSADDKTECLALYFRLHYAGFVQNSCYHRNVLVQPGPLTLSPDKRSLDTPSFRIIDFGRADQLENEDKNERKSEYRRKEWFSSRDHEVDKAHERLICRTEPFQF